MRSLLHALVFLALIPQMAKADGPLINTWVELRVSSCMPVTFEAPLYASGLYVTGDSHRTALITGTVVDAGLYDYYDRLRYYDMSDAVIRKEADGVVASLPRKSIEMNVVLPEWDASFCASSNRRVFKFGFQRHCDTLPLRGSCLAPLPLVVVEPEH